MQLFEYIDILDKPYDIFYTDSVSSPLHWHYYSEILYLKEGSIQLTCNEQSTILNPGDLCYIYPLQLHEVQKAATESANYAVVKFDIHTIHIPQAHLMKMYDYFVRRSSDTDFCLILRKDKIDTEKIDALVEQTVEESLQKNEFFALQIQANIFSLLIEIARNGDKKLIEQREEHTDTDFSFFHILEYIDIHSGEVIEIQDLAKRCHMSYSHFARLFRENYGRSCKEYITYIRLNKAQELLIHSDYSIAYIAQESGFFDSSHFIHAYKKWKGITPKQERRKLHCIS